MNTFEKKWKLFTFHILGSFFCFFFPSSLPFCTWIITGREEETEVHTEFISLVVEKHTLPKSLQTSNLVNWTNMKRLMIQQQFPPACVGHFSQSNGYKGLLKQSLDGKRVAWQPENSPGTWRIGIQVSHLVLYWEWSLKALGHRIYTTELIILLINGISSHMDEKRGETLGSVTWDVHAAVSRPVGV